MSTVIPQLSLLNKFKIFKRSNFSIYLYLSYQPVVKTNNVPQETLRRRQQAFRKTEEEIEARIADEEEKERLRLQEEDHDSEEENEARDSVSELRPPHRYQDNHTGNTSSKDAGKNGLKINYALIEAEYV